VEQLWTSRPNYRLWRQRRRGPPCTIKTMFRHVISSAANGQMRRYSGKVELVDVGMNRNHVGVYIHYPFCLQICSMCNFNKYRVSTDHTIDDRITKSLTTEIHTLFGGEPLQSRFIEKPRIASVYFGGGTPSIAPVSLVREVITALGQYNLAPDAEITIEANPKTFDVDKLNAWIDAGVNRMSLGVQSMRKEHLELLNRDHTVLDSLRSMEMARRHVRKVSIDFIYSMPNQTSIDLQQELTGLFQQASGLFDHLSMYELTLEHGTPLYKQVQDGKVVMPSNDLTGELSEVARDTAALHDYLQYEVSSFSHRGLASNMSRHNRAYWLGCDYLGIGPGAHGMLQNLDGSRARTINIRDIKGWLDQVNQLGHGIAKAQPISQEVWLEQTLMMHLRTSSGITEQVFLQQTGGQLSDVITSHHELVKNGFLLLENGRLSATERGLLVLDSLLVQLLIQPHK
jgi:putative oxygen-independent coproporphyrinogen III oxidase